MKHCQWYNNNSKANYDNTGNKIAYNREVLKSNLATEVAFKDCASFTKSLTNIDEEIIQ